MVDAAFAVLTEMRLELHLRGPGAGMPGLEEVAAIQQDEGGVARTHQLFGGGRLGRSVVEPAAAVPVLLPGKARAVAGKGFWLGHGILWNVEVACWISLAA